MKNAPALAPQPAPGQEFLEIIQAQTQHRKATAQHTITTRAYDQNSDDQKLKRRLQSSINAH